MSRKDKLIAYEVWELADVDTGELQVKLLWTTDKREAIGFARQCQRITVDIVKVVRNYRGERRRFISWVRNP